MSAADPASPASPPSVAWRIVKERYRERAFDGEGARRFGGRWNSPGRAVVYAAESRSLALLELLAGLGSTRPLAAYVTFRLDFDPELVHTVRADKLPEGWDARPPTRASQGVGDAWLQAGDSPILRVPSVVVPGEFNLVMAPGHPDFPSIRIGPPEATGFDPRL